MDVKEKTYYLCGPMSFRADTDFNFPAFHDAAAKLRAMGLNVINPAENFGGDITLPYLTYLREAFKQVSSAGAIVRLSGWENSNGANRECQIASWLSIPIYDLDNVLDTGI